MLLHTCGMQLATVSNKSNEQNLLHWVQFSVPPQKANTPTDQ